MPSDFTLKSDQTTGLRPKQTGTGSNIPAGSYGYAVHHGIASQVIPVGSDPARIAVEDMAVEAYRADRLTEHQLATLLGMERDELDGFLNREAWLDYTEGDLRREVEVGERLWKKRQDELDPSGQ